MLCALHTAVSAKQKRFLLIHKKVIKSVRLHTKTGNFTHEILNILKIKRNKSEMLFLTYVIHMKDTKN